jgi:hypothetical protein
MLTINLALVSEIEDHDPSDLARVAAALQRQVARDFAPLWDVSATVDGFPRLEDVPVGYWPMIIVPDVRGAAGIHLDKDGQPFALIEMSNSWSLTASHEMLEMLADPFGNRLVPGPSVKRGQGRVEYLVEVCDPSQASEFGYTVNDVLVSDFYTPRYFDPVRTVGTRYSFTGAIERPRQVLRGGYVSWHDPKADRWWQQVWFGARKEYRDLGVFEGGMESLRAEIDKVTPHPELVQGLRKSDKTLKAAVAVGKESEKAASSKAATWRRQIAAIRDTAAGGE